MKTTMKIFLLVLAASAVLLLTGCDQILEGMFQMKQNTIEITANIVIPSYQPPGWWDQKVWFRLRLNGSLVASGEQNTFMTGNSYGDWATASMKYQNLADGTYTMEVWLDQDGNGQPTNGEYYSYVFIDPNNSGTYISSITMPYPNPMGGQEGRYANLRVDLLYWY